VVVVAAVMMGWMSGSADEGDGDDGGPGRAANPAVIERAVLATQAVPSARVELATLYRGLDVVGGARPGVDDVRMVQRAAFDHRSRQAQAEADMSELAAALDATGDDVPGDFRAPARVLVDGDTAYVQLGPMAEAYGLEPTSWFRRDLAAFAAQPVDNETVALLLEPLGLLDLLRLPLDDVRVVGSEPVRGQPTTHVAATVGLGDRAAGSGGAADGDGAAGEVGDRFRRLGLDELPIDLWIGDDLVVRRLEFSIDGASTGRRAGPAMTTTFDVYDVGEPIEVTVPAAADVVDPAQLRGRSPSS
jgi:hypothetical protein